MLSVKHFFYCLTCLHINTKGRVCATVCNWSRCKHCFYVANVTWFGLQDLTMPGSHVDVNLHPTKQEVGFLHQDQLLEAIRDAVEELVLSSNDK